MAIFLSAIAALLALRTEPRRKRTHTVRQFTALAFLAFFNLAFLQALYFVVFALLQACQMLFEFFLKAFIYIFYLFFKLFDFFSLFFQLFFRRISSFKFFQAVICAIIGRQNFTHFLNFFLFEFFFAFCLFAGEIQGVVQNAFVFVQNITIITGLCINTSAVHRAGGGSR